MQNAARHLLHDWLDRTAILASAACAIHCLLVPVVLAMAPFLSRSLALGDGFHAALLLFALPVSGLGLIGGWRQHEKPLTLVVGAAGLALMALALLATSETMEKAATLVGGALLVTAHILNWLRRRSC